jgi:hypothetical protein
VNDQFDAEDLPQDYTLQNLRSWKKNAHYKWTCLQNQRIPPSWNTKGNKTPRLDPNDMTSWEKTGPSKSRGSSKTKRTNASKQRSGGVSEPCLGCQGVERAHTCEPWARSAPWDDKHLQDSPRKRRAPEAAKKSRSKSGKSDGQRKRQKITTSKPYEATHTEMIMVVDHTGATRYIVKARKPVSAPAAKHAARKFASDTEASCLSRKTVPRKLTPPIRQPKEAKDQLPAIRCKCRKSKCLKMYGTSLTPPTEWSRKDQLAARAHKATSHSRSLDLHCRMCCLIYQVLRVLRQSRAVQLILQMRTMSQCNGDRRSAEAAASCSSATGLRR